MAAGKSHSRPESVPTLDLGRLGTDLPEGDNDLQNLVKADQRLNTPNSKSTVSWGTQLSTPYHTTKQDLIFGGTVHRPCAHLGHPGQRKNRPPHVHRPCAHLGHPGQRKNRPPQVNRNQRQREEKVVPENLPPPSAKYQAQYEQRSQEIKDSYKDLAKSAPKDMSSTEKAQPSEMNNKEDARKRVDKPAYWYLGDEFQEKPPTPKVDNSPTIDDLAHMQANYTGQSYTDIQSARKYAAEDDLTNKRKQQVMEQVLIDLLSRHVISDPDQDKDPARANPADPLRQRPGMSMQPVRNKSRRLHDTKVSTVGAVTENSLRSRITFSARLLTRNGRDALREMFGFFFHHDTTITVYEYRNFGKGNFKALPFIVRGKYRHQTGRRKGKEFNSNDIELGKNLSFTTNNQSHLPETVKKQPIVTMRICEVDESCSSNGGGWEISTDPRDLDTDGRQERKDRQVTKKIQEYIRGKLRSRSVSVVIGLGRLFRSIDRSGDGVLSKDELSAALRQFEIVIPAEQFDSVWRVVDENSDGAIDYGEFMRAFIGEMSEFRKQLVRKVFKKLDPHKVGSASLLDMKKMYSANRHPLVMAGSLTQEEMEVRFVDSFSGSVMVERGRVTYIEFEEYYEGLSIVITSDDDFSNMMRNCWGV